MVGGRGVVPGHLEGECTVEGCRTEGGLTAAEQKSWKGEALEATLYLRLVENWC